VGAKSGHLTTIPTSRATGKAAQITPMRLLTIGARTVLARAERNGWLLNWAFVTMVIAVPAPPDVEDRRCRSLTR
jgi:hypothetical protein